MGRRKIYSNGSVRAEAHDARIRSKGGRVLRARLSPQAVKAVEKIIEAGEADSINAAINLALSCYKLPGKG